MSVTNPAREDRPIHGHLLIALAILVSFAALYGFSLATDPESYQATRAATVYVPTEDDYWTVPDTSHNKRIFALRDSLEARGFRLDGGAQVDTHSLDGVRGIYSYVAPNEANAPEWRLMATRTETCFPQSYLRISAHEETFRPEFGQRLISEWRWSRQWLPDYVISAGERLAEEAVQIWQADQAAGSTTALAASSTGEVTERRFRRMAKGVLQYSVHLEELVGDYQLEARLTDVMHRPSSSPSCDIVLHFRWMQ